VLLVFRRVLLGFALLMLVQAWLRLDFRAVQALVTAAQAERLLIGEMEFRRVLELGRQRR